MESLYSCPMASVVIIEDEQRIRELVARVLADRGHDVESTATAMEGLQAVVMVSPELVILDMGLPDLDGTELLKMILENIYLERKSLLRVATT